MSLRPYQKTAVRPTRRRFQNFAFLYITFKLKLLTFKLAAYKSTQQGGGGFRGGGGGFHTGGDPFDLFNSIFKEFEGRGGGGGFSFGNFAEQIRNQPQVFS